MLNCSHARQTNNRLARPTIIIAEIHMLLTCISKRCYLIYTYMNTALLKIIKDDTECLVV